MLTEKMDSKHCARLKTGGPSLLDQDYAGQLSKWDRRRLRGREQTLSLGCTRTRSTALRPTRFTPSGTKTHSSRGSLGGDVRFGSKADIEARSNDVRFTPKSGHGLVYLTDRRRWSCILVSADGLRPEINGR